MKQHGMLFKGVMVNKVKDKVAPKTQTRRPITFSNSICTPRVKRKEWHELRWAKATPWQVNMPTPSLGQMFLPAWRVPFRNAAVIVRPRIQPGDVIWVRETWRVDNWYYTDGRVVDIKYIADGTIKRFEWVTMADFRKFCKDKNHPSLFLPRWASRIDLLVLAMRSERVQEISEDDVRAEGRPYNHRNSPKVWFMDLWDSINTDRGFPWAGNHPVWIHDFKEVEG